MDCPITDGSPICLIFLCEVILFTEKKCSRWLDVFRSLKYIEKYWGDYRYDSKYPLVTDHMRVCDPKLSTISVILEPLSKPWYWSQTTRQCSESSQAFMTLMGGTSVDLHHGSSVVGNYGPQGYLKHFFLAKMLRNLDKDSVNICWTSSPTFKSWISRCRISIQSVL